MIESVGQISACVVDVIVARQQDKGMLKCRSGLADTELSFQLLAVEHLHGGSFGRIQVVSFINTCLRYQCGGGQFCSRVEHVFYCNGIGRIILRLDQPLLIFFGQFDGRVSLGNEHAVDCIAVQFGKLGQFWVLVICPLYDQID